MSQINPASDWLAKTAHIFGSDCCCIRLNVFTSQWAITAVLPLPATPRTSLGLLSIGFTDRGVVGHAIIVARCLC